MAQSVFQNEDIKRSVSLYVAPAETITVDLELAGRKEYTEEDIAALAADIHKNGQNTPALCRKNDKGEPVLVFGNRRRLAVIHLNKHLLQKGETPVLLQYKYQNLTPIEAFKAAISENRFRKEVSDVDHAHNIGVLLKRFNTPVDAIAEIYFPEATSPAAKADALRWVKDRIAVDELAPEAKQAVREGVMKVTTAVEMAKGLSPDEQREIVAKGGGGLKGGGKRIKVADVKKAKAEKAAAKGKAPAKGKAAAPAAAKGNPASTTVYEAAESLARAVDVWLEDATEKAQDSLIAAHKAYRKLVPAKGRKS